MTLNFRAAVLTGPVERLQVETVQAEAPRAGEVLVRIAAAGLCYTDLEVIEGQLVYPMPIVLEHEAAGVIAAVGPGVDPGRTGGAVVESALRAVFLLRAGSADFVRALCVARAAGGCIRWHDSVAAGRGGGADDDAHRGVRRVCDRHGRLRGGDLAGDAVRSGVPAGVRGADRRRRGGSDLRAALRRRGNGDRLRCSRLSAVQGARLAGASQIVAVDLGDAKLAMARDVGATHVVSARVADPVAAARSITGERGADCVLEAAGNQASFRLSTEACRVGGEIVWLGKVRVNQNVAFRWGALMGEKRITRSSYGGAQTATDFPALAQSYLRGELKLDGMITQRIAFEDINRGFDDLKAGRAIRSVIVFGGLA